MSDLVAFLRARLDEDEAAAKAATPGPWMTREGRDWLAENVIYGEGAWPGHIQQAANTDYAQHKAENATHIALHDPARALREVAAKRAILAGHPLRRTTWTESGMCCNTCGPLAGEQDGPCLTVRHLAAVYADHPDYDEAWRP